MEKQEKFDLCKRSFSFVSGVFIIAFLSLAFSISPNNNRKAGSTDKIPEFISIETLLKTSGLSATIKGLGGHQGECIEMLLQNSSPETLNVLIEPGRRLISFDSTMQDIFVVKKKEIILQPYQKFATKVVGFCCESTDRSPAGEAKFSVGYMAPAPWQKLANIIDVHNFPASTIQNAVWVVSNDHPVSSIHASNLDEINILRRTVADIKGIKLPWYTCTYLEDSTALFSGKHEKIIAKVPYYLSTNATVTILVQDKRGKLKKILSGGIANGSGQNLYELDLTVAGWPKGEYHLCIYENNSNLISKKTFIL